jgi:hypothetical protein
MTRQAGCAAWRRPTYMEPLMPTETAPGTDRQVRNPSQDACKDQWRSRVFGVVSLRTALEHLLHGFDIGASGYGEAGRGVAQFVRG